MTRDQKERTPDNFHNERAALREGWAIRPDPDLGWSIRSTGLPAKSGDGFVSDKAARDHVISMAWNGSPNHRAAIDFLDRFAPLAYAQMGVDDLKVASIQYRRTERERFGDLDAGRKLDSATRNDPVLHAALQAAWIPVVQAILDRASARKSPPPDFEVHHETLVARECFMIHVLENGDPGKAAAFARRRMCIDASPVEFFGTPDTTLSTLASLETRASPE